MNAPFAWIVIPGFLGAGLFFLRRWHRTTVITGTILALILAWLAWLIPIDRIIQLGPITFRLTDTLTVFGRRFILVDSDRPFLVISYLMAAFFFCASYMAGTERLFVPLGLVLITCLTAAQAVQPFLYAALLIEMATLFSIPILSPIGTPVRAGIMRFLTFQTLAMPFILFTGWMLAGVEASPGDTILVTRAGILLGLGFAFLLGVFPFHSWYPMLARESHPYSVGFVFMISTWLVSLFGLGFFERYAWLRDAQAAYELVRLGGIIMVLTGGVSAAFSRHLGKTLGYAVMVETGNILLVISLPESLPLFFMMLAPRVVALGVWGLALSYVIRRAEQPAHEGLTFTSLQGLAHKMPVVCAGIFISIFSLAGLPSLAGFPTRLALTQGLAAADAVMALLALIGSLGIFIGGLRILYTFIQGSGDQSWQINESWQIVFYLGIGMVMLLAMGLLPQFFLAPLAELANTIQHLTP